MEKVELSIKTKVASLLMFVVGFLAFPLIFLTGISNLHYKWWHYIVYFISAIFLPLIFFFLFLLFPVFLLKKKRWGWWGSIISLSFCILSTVCNFVSQNRFLGGEFGAWIDLFLPFYMLILILFLVDRKHYWEISSPIKIKITPKIKILTGALIAIILVSGWGIWDSYHPQGEVTIFTDKTNYEIGETIKITVKNNLNKTIWYTDCPPSPWWELRKLEGEEWKFIPVSLPRESDSVPLISSFYCPNKELKSNFEISYLWNFKTNIDTTQLVDPGIYKFSFSYGYGFSQDSLHHKTIYSNEFTIEEIKIFNISDREIYRNEEYGFEIRYPRDWDAWDDTQRDCFPQHPCIFSFNIHSPVIATGGIEVSIFNNPDALSAEDWLYKFIKIEELEDLEEFSLKEIEIAGEKGLRLTYLPPHPGQVTWQDNVYISEGNFIYNISLPGLPNLPDIQEIIDQMLSTFRFLEEDETANWKTYRNEEYKYELKYPKDWEVEDRSSDSISIRWEILWVSIQVFNNFEKLSINDWVNKYKNWGKVEELFVEEIEINGEKGLRVAYIPIARGYKLEHIYFLQGMFIYEISRLKWLSPIEKYEKEEETINRIISTFRFIE